MSLTKEKRDALPDSDFAVPGKRKLPIHDETHVRLAHDMLDRTQGLSSEEKAVARRRILERAHHLGIDTKAWTITASFRIDAMAIEMPVVPNHPNRMPFSGVLTRVDQPSDVAPGGSSGKRTILPKDVAEAAIPSLMGMAVDFTPGFDGHDRTSKIGIITGAEVEGDAVAIEGFFYAKDFPRECERIRAEKDALGFSYELDARIQDADADLWVIEHCIFTGAAVLYKDLAAYTSTSLSASADEGLNMTPEELKALMAEALKPVTSQLEAQGKELAEIKAGKGASLAGPIIDQVKPHVESLNACAAAMEAAGIGSDSRAGHAGVIRRVAAHMAAEAVSGKTPMIYRDHDYLPDARVEAAADVTKAVATAVAEAVKPLNEQLAAANTKIADLSAKAFNSSPEPERKTLSPQIKSLLAKGGISDEDLASGKRLSASDVDAVLDAAGMKGPRAIEFKLKLREQGLMEVGRA
ncbi:DUF6582 domain-containing protein [Herbaspirillum frisingense]|uniref:DUF6582 domain-containing protein n=1 Tax=Herbaspirillum frisingense TaxID=92645 RepID=UPI0039AEE07B